MEEVKEQVKEKKENNYKSTSGKIDVEQVRKDFPMLQQKLNGKPLIYLDSAVTCQKPQVVIDRVAEFYTNEYGKPNEKHSLSKFAKETKE